MLFKIWLVIHIFAKEIYMQLLKTIYLLYYKESCLPSPHELRQRTDQRSLVTQDCCSKVPRTRRPKKSDVLPHNS